MDDLHALYLGRQWVMWNQPRESGGWDKPTAFHALAEGVALDVPEGGYAGKDDVRLSGVVACGFADNGGYRHIVRADPNAAGGRVCGNCVRVLGGSEGGQASQDG